MKYIILTTLLLTSMQSHSQQREELKNEQVNPRPVVREGNENDESEVWFGPLTKDVTYNGQGTLKDFLNNNISHNIKEYLDTNNVTGKMYAMLTIDTAGKVIDAKVPPGKGIHPIIDNEVVRILKLTTWNPALVNNRRVCRRIAVPINL